VINAGIMDHEDDSCEVLDENGDYDFGKQRKRGLTFKKSWLNCELTFLWKGFVFPRQEGTLPLEPSL
jgi:hypothetical protein